MRRILFPTDFSELAHGAFDYTVAMARDTGASIEVLHAYHGNLDLNQPLPVQPAESIYDIKKDVIEDFTQRAHGVAVDYELEVGFAVDEIVERSQEPDVDLIVMGTHRNHGFWERLFGSVSSDVTQRADCPVLLVPQGQVYSGINTIVFGVDDDERYTTAATKLARFAAAVRADIYVVHVDDERDEEDLRAIEAQFKRILPDTVKYETVISESVEQGLEDYAHLHGADIIVLASHKRNFLERIFGKSTTKEMALDADFPLMVIREQER